MTAVEEVRTRRNAAWLKGRPALERAETGQRREEALYEIVALRNRIVRGRAETLADAAVQLRPHVLLASVLAVVAREADAA